MTGAPVDMGAVRAAAQGFSASQGAEVPLINVIETDQPFDEIAAGLEEGSYTRDGSLLDDRLGDKVVGDAGDGVAVFGPDRESVESATADEGEPPPLAEDVRAITQPSRMAVTPQASDCLSEMAIGLDAEPPAGEVKLTAAETADDQSLFEPSLLPAIESGEPSADGSELTVPFELSDNPLPLSADAVLESFEGAYDCG